MKLVPKYKLVLLMVLLLIACQKEELVPIRDIKDIITFSINSNADAINAYTASTRAVEEPLALISEDGADTLTFDLTVTDGIYTDQQSNISDTIVTKGTSVTNDNLMDVCEEQIAMKAFYQNEQFINDVLVLDESGYARTSIASYWPIAEEALVDFWSFHPKEISQSQNFTINNEETTPSLSFYYNMKDGDKNTLVDATKQKDYILAYNRQGKESGSVDLNYIHALSAVKFNAGKTLAGEILNITITNVYAGGKLTFSPNGTSKISWELDNERYTLNQDFSQKIDEDLSGDSSQAITKDIDNTVFMLIPQPLTDKTLSIEFRRKGETEAKIYTVNMPGGSWETGKSYTYTLTLMDGLGIKIETEETPTDNKVIDGIKIKNVNNKTCYVRAMVIANWVDQHGNIAAIFNPDETNLKITPENSNYQLSADWGSYWLHDAQTNIYYYKKPLLKEEYTAVDLFEKFTNPTSRTEDLKLDFMVIVQAVEAESSKASVKAAWGETIAGYLE